MTQAILDYNAKQTEPDQAICKLLMGEISAGLPEAEAKVWHGAPVWFLDGNPIVGYHHLKAGMRLMFWSGQSFEEPGLATEGSFKAATLRIPTVDDIDVAKLQIWLRESREIQWDYKNLMKSKAGLVRIS